MSSRAGSSARRRAREAARWAWAWASWEMVRTARWVFSGPMGVVAQAFRASQASSALG